MKNAGIALLLLLWLAALSFAQKPAPRPTPLPPSIDLSVARDVAPGPKIRLSANTRNVGALTLSAARIDSAAWLQDRVRGKKQTRPTTIGPIRSLGSVRMIAPGEKRDPGQLDLYRSRQLNLPRLPPGVYLIAAQGSGASAWSVVNITELAVLVKRAPRQTLVWVSDHKTGRTVAGAQVKLFDAKGALYLEQATNRDGVARFETRPARGESVLIQENGDVAALSLGVEDPDGKLVAHFSTDRPIYRPGQSVLYRAILRTSQGRGWAVPANEKVGIEVRDSHDNVLEKNEATTGRFGTVSGEIKLSEEAMLGPHTVVLTHKSGSAYASFTVAAYRKPEFTVRAAPEKPRYLSGEKVGFTVDSRYYFGAAVPGASVKYQVRRAALAFASDESESGWQLGGDGNLYPSDTYQRDPFVTEGEATTDAKGRATISVNTLEGAPDATYTLSVTVTDGQRRQVEGSASVPVFGAALRLGLIPDSNCVARGGTFRATLRAGDLDGKPTAADVTVSVERQLWEEKEKQMVWREAARAQVRVPASGKASVPLPAQYDGELRLTATAKDSGGRRAQAVASVWVAAPDWKPEKEPAEPQLRLRLDRAQYAPGAKIRAFVTNTTPARPVLLTLEHGIGQLAYRVLRGGGSYLWEGLATRELSPNGYVEVSQWARPAQLLADSELIAVPDPTRRLSVTVTPEKSELRPGDTARARVRVTDVAGRPVAAEVGVSVVDAAIFALRPDATPDPLTTFWGRRASQVETFQSAPEEVSGGAYQRANGESAPLRQRFVDTAFWSAHLVTDASGEAQVSFEVPGNLTTWRWSALAVTDQTQAGRVVTDTVATRSVTLRLATPRQAVLGDAWTLIGTVNNRTDSPQSFDATLKAEGATLSSDATVRVSVPARGEGKVSWRVAVSGWPESGAARFEASVASQSGSPELSDRLRQSVPVLPRGVVIDRPTLVKVSESMTLPLPLNDDGSPRLVLFEVRHGVRQAAQAAARDVLSSRPHSPEEAADTLRVAVVAPGLGVEAAPATVRDAVLHLLRTQRPDGTWGLWEGAPADAHATAHVLRTLREFQKSNAAKAFAFPEAALARAQDGARQLYKNTDSWERRALLAAELGGAEREEVVRRGQNLSPYARLRLLGRGALSSLTRRSGSERASVAAGVRTGWRFSETQTSAEALFVQPADTSLAHGLAFPDQTLGRSWQERADQAAMVVALARFKGESPGPAPSFSLLLEGKPLVFDRNGRAHLTLPPGDMRETLTLEGKSSGVVYLSVRRPHVAASASGSGPSRLLRRLERQDADGLWQEVSLEADAQVAPGETLRLTTMVWPAEGVETMRLEQTLPAGFEFVESDLYVYQSSGFVQEEVRDGRLIHYVQSEGRPLPIRCYFRAEAEGVFTLNPARAADLFGGSDETVAPPIRLTVRETKK